MTPNAAPVSVNTVTLLVSNRQRVENFYRDVVGLNQISSDAEKVTLGQSDKPLLHLCEDAAARSRPEEAGLFHTAFLLPQRSDLGSWLKHATQCGVKLDGASDHLVSEALYLQDPEGNGIEMYVDRDRSEWQYSGDEIVMDTKPLDIDSIVSSAISSSAKLPENTVIGHVHLQVGNIPDADAFYRDKLGLARMAHRPQASFYASGDYHHHLATNVWHSQGCGMRTKGTAGLLELELTVATLPDAKTELIDPWGTHLRFTLE